MPFFFFPQTKKKKKRLILTSNDTMKLAKCNLRNQPYESCFHQIHGDCVLVLDVYHDILTSNRYITISTLSEI